MATLHNISLTATRSKVISKKIRKMAKALIPGQMVIKNMLLLKTI
jgi:hypothetical protein